MADESIPDGWIATRMRDIESSGIRKVFELARSLKDPINLSIGQPDFDVPGPVKAACHAAIDAGHNSYTPTQGIAPLRAKLLEKVKRQLPGQDRELFITSGTSGGLVLALACTVNPGDEVIVFDPYFVMYPHLVRMAGGVPVFIDSYPDFRLDIGKVRKAVTARTRAIIVNSPANPTGHVASREEMQGLAELAAERRVLLISDEIYRDFVHERAFVSPAEYNPHVLVIDGFSKSHAMTGWRLGFAHGPQRLIEEMIKLQQFTFVCAPSMVQHAGLAALDVDISHHVREYRGKRDLMHRELGGQYHFGEPGGAFYLFARAPGGDATAFVQRAIGQGLLVIPGNVFSRADTHFRISYAASDETLRRGIEVLKRLA
jgi:aspartate aminotransferase/aminotransferase